MLDGKNFNLIRFLSQNYNVIISWLCTNKHDVVEVWEGQKTTIYCSDPGQGNIVKTEPLIP